METSLEPRGDFDPVAYINDPSRTHMSLGLSRIRKLLSALGDPQDDLRFVHVAGTNGKGSTCAYISSILMDAGYRCGLFTSPYIERFNERIRIDGVDISDEDLEDATLTVKAAHDALDLPDDDDVTEFELITAVAFVYFKKMRCDVVVLEVGLGGRLDSTNVVIPEVCVITHIGLDHCAVLGESLEEIATEKAGIIKQGVPVVSAHQDPRAASVIEDVCRRKHCSLTFADPDPIEDSVMDFDGMSRMFTYKGVRYKTMLLGRYQELNASLAIETANVLRKGFDIDEKDIVKGIEDAKWVGRFEIEGLSPLVIVDGAHNPDGIEAFISSLDDACDALALNAKENTIFVIGILADKDYGSMLRSLLPYAKAFILYEPDNPRALSVDGSKGAIEDGMRILGISRKIEVMCAKSAQDAACKAMDIVSPEDIVCALGTLYSLSDIRSILRRRIVS